MAFGTGAVLLALTVTSASMAYASSTVSVRSTPAAPTPESSTTTTSLVPSTHVASRGPITAGPSRSECLTPNNPAGAYGLSYIQSVVTQFDALTNSTVTCVSAYLNWAQTWAQWEHPWVTQSQYGYTSWVAEEPQSRQLVLVVNLIPTSVEDVRDPLGWEQSCAAGDFNSYATELGTNLVAAGLQNSVIRLGTEMNGVWEPDFIGTTTQEQHLWATCFANEVTGLRRAAGEHFLIDWNPDAFGVYLYANFYPGNAYVDILGLDLFDTGWHSPTMPLTFSRLANEYLGLTYFEAFATAKGKPMSLPEWGLATIPSGDDPGYINGIGSTFAKRNFAFETYFDATSPNSKALPLGPRTPRSVVAFRVWFGNGGTLTLPHLRDALKSK